MFNKATGFNLKRSFILVFAAALMVFGAQSPAVQAWNNGAANTPPMGWNSYDSWNWNVTESQVKSATDYMKNNLKSHGWQYIIVDWAWYYPGSGTGSPNQNNLQPTLRMDGNGRLLPDTNRFPSASGNNGFKPLADYIHNAGLKFGIHIMRGISRQAVAQNTPILGSNNTANQINNSTTASWLNLMWGIDMTKPGAQPYLNSLFQLYASWGVDFVKVDDIAAPTYYSAEIQGYHNAISNSGRNMVLSLSPGPTSTSNGSNVSANANMWRVVNDLWDNWSNLDAEFSVLNSWTPYRSSGAWPDADMIPIGHLSLEGPVGSPRYSNFSSDEKRTLMTLWAIARSPLIWGGYLPDNQSADLALMTNDAVIAVDQTSVNNKQLSATGSTKVWVADVANSTDKYIALFNEGGSTANVSVSLSSIGMSAANVTDLWSGSSLGKFTATFSQNINSHGAGLYRLASTSGGTTYYKLLSRNSSKCLDVQNPNLNDGANVDQWTCNGNTWQSWGFVASGSNFNIVSQNSGKCLDVFNNSTADGANVDQWACNGGANQQWQWVAHGSYFQIKGVQSGKCLDVFNNSTADGANVDIWTCKNGANQDWSRQ